MSVATTSRARTPRALPAAKPNVYSVTLRQRLEYHMQIICGILGCDAIEARALWSAGGSTIIAEVAAGAAEGDVMRLQRLPRRPIPR